MVGVSAKDRSAGDCSQSDSVEVVAEQSRQGIVVGEASGSVTVEKDMVEEKAFGCCAG